MRRTIFFGALAGALSAFLVGGTIAVATNTNFILGSTTTNKPDALTSVTAQNKDGHGGLNGPMIQLTNASTGGSATPLGLTAGSGRPPFITNSSAKVGNLNADKLDGMDSSAFVQGGGGRLLRNKVYIQGGVSAEVLNQPNKPPFNIVYDCPDDLITRGHATFFNRSVLDADLVVQGLNDSDATHGGYGTKISIGALQDETTFNAGWEDGHVATVWLFVNQRYNEPDPAKNGCYVTIMAVTK
jgi:hypothetical protein